jgi:small Trp-rich protein
MGFLIVGILFLLLKYLEIDPVSSWSWWWVLLPFGLAWIWWDVVDPALGLSKKREARKAEERKIARLEKTKQELGLDPRSRRRPRR